MITENTLSNSAIMRWNTAAPVLGGSGEVLGEKKKEMKIHCNYINCRHAAEFMTCIFIMKWLIETGNLTLPLSHSCSFCSTHLKIYCLNFQYIGWNIRELLTIVSCYSLKLYSYSSYLNTNFYSLTYIILPSPFQPKWVTSILTV